MNTAIKRILIVGAGPAGLSAAVELARHGFIPDVIEKKDKPSSLSRAVGILPNTMKLLEPSGVALEIESQAVIVENIIFHKNAAPIAKVPVNLLNERYMKLYSLAQDKTEAILANKFADNGGSVSYQSELKNISQQDNKVLVHINGEQREYDLVIGADGTKSTVRTLLNIEFKGYELEEDWSIADVTIHDDLIENNFKGFLKDNQRVVVMIPLEKHRLRIISNTKNALEEVPIDLNVREIKREGRFTISIRQAEKYRKENVFLVGDAAHSHSPVGGRGMNLGIADAIDLAGRIINGHLDKYHEARYKIGKKTIFFTERARKSILSKNRIRKEVFFFLLKLMSKYNCLNKFFIRRVFSS